MDVVLAVKDAETTHRIVSIPIKQKLVNSEVIKTIKRDEKYGDKDVLTFVDNIKMTLRIVDLDDTTQFIDVESYGKGVDSGDKGFGKASTYARKYALLNAYKIATGTDPDAHKSKDQELKRTPSEKRVAVTNYLNFNTNAALEIAKHFGVDSVTELTDEHIKTIYATYKKKNLI